jgi:hypothetical protein
MRLSFRGWLTALLYAATLRSAYIITHQRRQLNQMRQEAAAAAAAPAAATVAVDIR